MIQLKGPAVERTRRSMTWRYWLAAMLGTVALAACDILSSLQPAADERAVVSAQFGVFYGSQLRERDEVPFELDSGRQQLGFRIEFAAKLRNESTVEWELSKPGKPDPGSPPISDPSGRVTKISSATAPAGASRFEQAITLEPGDPLGLWNIRVTHKKSVLIDRPFVVFDPAARRRAAAAARLPDAGL